VLLYIILLYRAPLFSCRVLNYESNLVRSLKCRATPHHDGPSKSCVVRRKVQVWVALRGSGGKSNPIFDKAVFGNWKKKNPPLPPGTEECGWVLGLSQKRRKFKEGLPHHDGPSKSCVVGGVLVNQMFDKGRIRELKKYKSYPCSTATTN
jgi:hypothetical protein